MGSLAMANGGRASGSPRNWPEHHPGDDVAFVLDLDDNSIAAVFHDCAVDSTSP